MSSKLVKAKQPETVTHHSADCGCAGAASRSPGLRGGGSPAATAAATSPATLRGTGERYGVAPPARPPAVAAPAGMLRATQAGELQPLFHTRLTGLPAARLPTNLSSSGVTASGAPCFLPLDLDTQLAGSFVHPQGVLAVGPLKPGEQDSQQPLALRCHPCRLLGG